MSIARIHPTPFCLYCNKEGLPSDHLLRDKLNKEKMNEMYFESSIDQPKQRYTLFQKEKKEKKEKKIKKETVIPMLFPKENTMEIQRPKLTIEVCKEPLENKGWTDIYYSDTDEFDEYTF